MRNIAAQLTWSGPDSHRRLDSYRVRATPLKRLRVCLGTLVAIEATSGSTSTEGEAISGPRLEDAIEAGFAALTAVEHRLHPHTSDSDLARINRTPLGTPVLVHDSTCELLDLARQLNELTNGIFDPCLPARPGKLTDIEVSKQHVICHAPVALDFGGFAKGYAVDCAIGALLAHGCSSGLVNAGGDLRVFGSGTEPMLLRGPGGELREIVLSDAALAVSDVDSPHRPAEHQGYYGRRGQPSTVRRYAAVTAKQAVVADALTKCALLCADDIARRVLQTFDAKDVSNQ